MPIIRSLQLRYHGDTCYQNATKMLPNATNMRLSNAGSGILMIAKSYVESATYYTAPHHHHPPQSPGRDS